MIAFYPIFCLLSTSGLFPAKLLDNSNILSWQASLFSVKSAKRAVSPRVFQDQIGGLILLMLQDFLAMHGPFSQIMLSYDGQWLFLAMILSRSPPTFDPFGAFFRGALGLGAAAVAPLCRSGRLCEKSS